MLPGNTILAYGSHNTNTQSEFVRIVRVHLNIVRQCILLMSLQKLRWLTTNNKQRMRLEWAVAILFTAWFTRENSIQTGMSYLYVLKWSHCLLGLCNIEMTHPNSHRFYNHEKGPGVVSINYYFWLIVQLQLIHILFDLSWDTDKKVICTKVDQLRIYILSSLI